MKRIWLISLACAGLLACNQEPAGYELNGEVDGIKNATIYLKAFRNKMFQTVDSTQLKDGKFKFTGHVDIPLLYGLATEEMDYPAQLFLENKNFHVKLSSNGMIQKIENSPVNDLFIQNGEKVFDKHFNIDSLIAAHPASPVPAFFLYRYFTYRLPLDQLKAARAKIAPQLDKLPYVADLDTIIRALEKVQVGQVAPDFTLPDTTGQAVTLSSFRGKYVLLDFWASWCPPCRRENPNVVAAYQKYKDNNFTIIGISLDTKKAAWLKGIRDDKLEWTQLSDLKYWDSEVPALYGIRAIPSNVLLDPQGVIIAKDLREDALSQKLEAILK